MSNLYEEDQFLSFALMQIEKKGSIYSKTSFCFAVMEIEQIMLNLFEEDQFPNLMQIEKMLNLFEEEQFLSSAYVFINDEVFNMRFGSEFAVEDSPGCMLLGDREGRPRISS